MENRLPNNASCILSVFSVKYGNKRRLNYTRILSVKLIAKTPKSVVSSGVGHLLTIAWGQKSFNVSIKVEYCRVLIFYYRRQRMFQQSLFKRRIVY